MFPQWDLIGRDSRSPNSIIVQGPIKFRRRGAFSAETRKGGRMSAVAELQIPVDKILSIVARSAHTAMKL